MQSKNPVFNSNPAFNGRGQQQSAWGNPASGYAGGYGTPDLNDMYNRPSATPADMGRMTIDDVIMKTAIMFGVLLVGAAAGWVVPALALPGMIVGLVLGLVISFKSSTNKALILSYAAFEGLFVGGISNILSNVGTSADGSGATSIVGQAVIGTLVAFGVMLTLYKTGMLRATARFKKIMMVSLISYGVIALASFVSSFFGVGSGWGFYGAGGLGILLCMAGVALASFSLILDFDFVDQGIRQGLPQRYSWLAAFGLVVTLVWLYIELLRLLAILRGND